jgi:hypothetical protein
MDCNWLGRVKRDGMMNQALKLMNAMYVLALSSVHHPSLLVHVDFFF